MYDSFAKAKRALLQGDLRTRLSVAFVITTLPNVTVALIASCGSERSHWMLPTLGLVLVWALGTQRGSLPAWLLPIEGAALAVASYAAGSPLNLLGLYYPGLFARTLLASDRQAPIVAVVWIAALYGSAALTSGTMPAPDHLFGMPVAVGLMRLLAWQYDEHTRMASSTAALSRALQDVVGATGAADVQAIVLRGTTVIRGRRTTRGGHSVTPSADQDAQELLSALRGAASIALTNLDALATAKANELRLRSILHHAVDAVVVVAADGTIAYVSPAIERIIGVPAENLLATDLGTLVHPDDRAQLARIVWARGRAALPPALRLRHANGAWRVCEVEVADLNDESTVQGTAIALHDVTERRHAEAQLAMTNRLSSLGTLAAGMAHEINNPLAALILDVESLNTTLHAEVAEPVEAKEIAGSLLESLDRIRDIVADLRLLSRPQDSPSTAIDVGACVAAAARMAQPQLRHKGTLTISVTPGLPSVIGTDTRITQVVLNLLVNAAHALPENAFDLSSVKVAVAMDGDRVLIEVKDTGCGIAPDDLAHVFDPFFTTKAVGAGTGLGLSVCSALVGAAGGTMSLESEVGVGTTARVWLRTTDAPISTCTPIPASGLGGLRRVLVIDDDAAIRRAFTQILRRQYQVVTVESAGEALRRLDDGEDFDVIFCDVMMPGLNGGGFVQRLSTEHHAMTARVVLITGGAFSVEAADFLRNTTLPRLVKPFRTQQVRGAIASVLAQSAA